jgi:uncharacterized protein (TIGR02301 family)
MRAGFSGRIALVLVLSLTPLAGLAQQSASRAPPARAQPAPQPVAPDPPAPPYEPDLLRLSEIMGSLAYLREICAAREAPAWRDRMVALIEAEGRVPSRRDRLTDAYNRGFKAYAGTHRTCLPASEEASTRLARDGERLAKLLAGRFGG